MAKKESPAVSHVLLLDDCEHGRAGKVLAVDAETIARLDAGEVKYRPATPRERQLAGTE